MKCQILQLTPSALDLRDMASIKDLLVSHEVILRPDDPDYIAPEQWLKLGTVELVNFAPVPTGDIRNRCLQDLKAKREALEAKHLKELGFLQALENRLLALEGPSK